MDIFLWIVLFGLAASCLVTIVSFVLAIKSCADKNRPKSPGRFKVGDHVAYDHPDGSVEFTTVVAVVWKLHGTVIYTTGDIPGKPGDRTKYRHVNEYEEDSYFSKDS